MKIFLKVRDNRIEDVKFKTFGCAAAIASSSMATEMIKAKPRRSLEPDKRGKLLKLLKACLQENWSVQLFPGKLSTGQLTITEKSRAGNTSGADLKEKNKKTILLDLTFKLTEKPPPLP